MNALILAAQAAAQRRARLRPSRRRRLAHLHRRIRSARKRGDRSRLVAHLHRAASEVARAGTKRRIPKPGILKRIGRTIGAHLSLPSSPITMLAVRDLHQGKPSRQDLIVRLPLWIPPLGLTHSPTLRSFHALIGNHIPMQHAFRARSSKLLTMPKNLYHGTQLHMPKPSGRSGYYDVCWSECFKDPCAFTFDGGVSGGCVAISPERNGGFLNAQFFQCLTNCGVYFRHEKERQALTQTRLQNLGAVLLELPGLFIPGISRSGRIKTRGIIVGLETGYPPTGIGAVGGGAVAIFYEGDWLTPTNCAAFVSGELGFAMGVDLSQSTTPAIIWSTSSLEELTGESFNISGDAFVVSAGVSFSSGGNVTGYIGPVQSTLPTISFTAGETWKSISCSEARRILQSTGISP